MPKTTIRMFEFDMILVWQIVIKVKWEYMMALSDQILWIFSRLNGSIYFVKKIFLKLKEQDIYFFCNYFVNSLVHVVKTSLIRLVLFHPLNTSLPDIKSLQTHWRCIDLCFVLHTVLIFVIGQGIGGKNVITVWKVSIQNNWITKTAKSE